MCPVQPRCAESPRLVHSYAEIMRIVNLGLMEVDPGLRRFEPDRPVTQRLKITQVATRAAAKIEDIELAAFRKLTEELIIILSDIMIFRPSPER